MLQALLDSIPVALGIATYGVVFGALARQAGLTLLDSLGMSALVFSGSAQFVALPLLQAGVGPAELFVTALLVSLRHLVMGLSLGPRVRGLAFGHRLVLAFGLNDEAYGLTTWHASRHGFNPAYMRGAGLATFLAWTTGTAAGAAFGAILPDPARWGLDFAFTAVFIALLVPQVKGKAGLAAAVAGGLTAVLSAPLLGGGGQVLAGALAAAAVGGILDREP